jgi:hypothetical protein
MVPVMTTGPAFAADAFPLALSFARFSLFFGFDFFAEFFFFGVFGFAAFAFAFFA